MAEHSLRIRKGQGEDVLAWQVLGLDGTVNIHRAPQPALLDDLFRDGSTVVATAHGGSHVLAYSPPAGTVAFYRLIPANSCTTEDVPFAP